MTETPRSINQILHEISGEITDKTISLGELVDFLHERGFGVLLFLFALPMALPLPVPPGINLLFATPLLFLSFQLLYGAKKPWLPPFLRKREFNKTAFDKMVKQGDLWLKRLSWFIRPRLGFVTQGWVSHIVGLFSLLFALCICIPIPLTNTVPSFAVLLMAVGLLMRDGLAIIAGMVIGSAWIGILATLGISGLKALIQMLF